jgi:hypothetical protein
VSDLVSLITVFSFWITRAWLRAKYSETTRFETIDSAHLHMTVSATQAPVSEKLMEGFRK